MRALFLPLMFFLASCQGIDPSEKVARQFVETYYQKADLPSALLWTDGLAAEKVRQGIQLTEKQFKDAGTHQPKVSYDLLESHPGAQEARYLFFLKFRPEQMSEIRKKALIKVKMRGGDWKITQFSELPEN